MANPVGKGAAIFGGRAFDWARNANEFGLEGGAGNADDGIPVSAHVHERYMRRALWIAQCTRFLNITALRVFQRRAHTVMEGEIHGGLEFATRAIRQEQ